MQAFTQDLTHHHIIDPRTGYSSPHLASATVVAQSGSMADGLATTLMVMNLTVGRTLVEELPGVEACLITKGLNVILTSGFEKRSSNM